jgi:hypothetical protein
MMAGTSRATRSSRRVVRSGSTLTFCEATVHGMQGGAETLLATMTATMMAMTGRDDVKG